MRLRIVLPDRLRLDTEVRRIVAEAPNGSFGLLPDHIDVVSALAPGILVYEDAEGREHYAGIQSGTLVKIGDEVRVATANAVLGDDLESLQRRVREVFREAEERERDARSALARLEAQMVRRFLELEQRP